MTRQELAELGLEHLIGTDLLRAYMHGYFMDNKLYERSKVVAKPSNMAGNRVRTLIFIASPPRPR